MIQNRTLVSITWLVFVVFLGCRGDEKCHDLSRILKAINKATILYKNYYQDFNLDGWYGFSQLEVSLNRTDVGRFKKLCGSDIIDQIEKLKRELRYLNKKTVSILKRRHATYYKSLSQLTNLIVQIDNPSVELTEMDPAYFRLPLKMVSYNENFGDECYTKLTKSCSITESCYKFFLPKQRLMRYSATHAIIYLALYKHKQCYKKEGSDLLTERKMNSRINNLCSTIHEEVETFMEKEHRNDRNLDLFLEEVFLCGGMMGFNKDFMTERTLETILQSQNWRGCFTLSHKKRKHGQGILSRTKRRSAFLGGTDCSDHTLGLGVSALSKFLIGYF